MGSFFKSKTKVTQTQQPFETNPWKPQEEYLKEGFTSAKDALTAGQGVLGGITDYTADLTTGQDQALQDSIAFNQGLLGQGQNLVNQGAGLTGNLNTYGQNANQVFNSASADPTQTIVNNAGQYINNDVIQGQIDASINDINRGFQQQRGQINGNAVGGGNINSTRAGVLEAMAQDDAMDRAASVAAGIRGDAYGNGLNLASQNYQQGIQNQLSANQQVGQSGELGLNTLKTGAQLGQGAAGSNFDAQSIYQQQQQNEINGKIQQATQPMDLVSKYMSAIGGNYGNSGFTTHTDVKQSGSGFGKLLGAASSIAGAGSKMGGFGLW